MGFAAALSFGNDSANDFFTSVRATRSCGRLGPARLGTTVASRGSACPYTSASASTRREEALGLAIGLDEGDLAFAPARLAEVGERPFVHGEDAAGPRRTRVHVRDRHPVGHGQRRHPGAEVFDELADDALLAEASA